MRCEPATVSEGLVRDEKHTELPIDLTDSAVFPSTDEGVAARGLVVWVGTAEAASDAASDITGD